MRSQLADLAAYDLVFDGTATPERRAAAIEDGENLASSVRESSHRTPGSADMDVFVDYTASSPRTRQKFTSRSCSRPAFLSHNGKTSATPF
jgi:hypothetical protein